jgi:hypothetical protein
MGVFKRFKSATRPLRPMRRWIGCGRGRWFENSLARHLEDGVLVLYDVSSSHFEGGHCPPAEYGHSRDHQSDRAQIVYGLLCTRDVCRLLSKCSKAIRLI